MDAELLFSVYPEIDFCRVKSSSITKTCPKEEEKEPSREKGMEEREKKKITRNNSPNYSKRKRYN